MRGDDEVAGVFLFSRAPVFLVTDARAHTHRHTMDRGESGVFVFPPKQLDKSYKPKPYNLNPNPETLDSEPLAGEKALNT